jgi:excisionase family DNA binding protein
MNEDFKTINELAEILKVPKSWLYSKTRETGNDAIPRLRVGKYIRFRLPEVMEWLEGENKKLREI